MTLADLTSSAAVRRALDEFDDLGREAFLAKYRFGPATRYFVMHDGRQYDSKAIAGAAYGFQFPLLGALRAADFSGGDATVRRKLEDLGFVVTTGTAERRHWWDGDPSERYWLEISDRRDIGVDLKAPQLDEGGAANPGYRLINEVEHGDIVFHYDTSRRAIVALSVASGRPWEEDIVWASHRGSTRRRRPSAYRRPGWRIGLEGTRWLEPPITLAQLAESSELIRGVHDDLRRRHPGWSLHLPFSFYGGTSLRPMQYYLNKLPAAIVDGIAPLARSASARADPPVAIGHAPGASYQRAAEDAATSERDPFSIDPAIVDRGLRDHAETQNALADHLESRGHEPRSPTAGDPAFDLAWLGDDALFVAEVKSITDANEEKQLRLAIGQVLRYRHLMTLRYGCPVRAIVAIERAPRDASWVDLCESLEIQLVWPGAFDRLS